jgi:hypothetical protein
MNIKTEQTNRVDPEDSIQIALIYKCPNFDVIVSKMKHNFSKTWNKKVLKQILLFYNEDIILFFGIYFYFIFIIILPVITPIYSINLLNLNNLWFSRFQIKGVTLA